MENGMTVERGLCAEDRPSAPPSLAGVSADRAARCDLYRLFAQAFRHPGGGMEELVAELRLAVADHPNPVPSPIIAMPPLAELSQRYTQLFEASNGRSAISLHESDFASKTRATVWEDIVRFYEHFGLNYNGQSIRLWPDHLALELECMHYLAFLESGMRADAGPLLRAERDFLDRRLLTWTPELAQRLKDAPQAEPYAALAAWLCDCLRADRAWLEQAIAEIN
jgi:DMSO reductase family type II enzyme chaperone